MVKFEVGQFVYLGMRIANKQDKGLRLSITELKKMLEAEQLISWIEENICHLDFWDNETKQVMEVEFYSIANCYDFGIETDGLARLSAYCFAFIENLPKRTIKDL